jgi:hypothetical protein
MHVATAHAAGSDLEEDEDADDPTEDGADDDESACFARWSYRCQECENSDVARSPFPKHVVVSLNRV